MPNLATRSWGWVLLQGILAVIVGVVALVWPGLTLATFAILLGAWIVVDGITSVVTAIALPDVAGRHRVLMVILGILGIIIGVIVLWNPFASAVGLAIFIALMFAAWLLFAGIRTIVIGIRLRDEIKGEWMLIVAGVLAILGGIAAAIIPFVVADVLILVLGGFLVVIGIWLVISAFRLRSDGRNRQASDDAR